MYAFTQGTLQPRTGSLPKGLKPMKQPWIILLLAAALTVTSPALGDSRVARGSDSALWEHGWIMDVLTLTGTDAPGIRHLVATGRVLLPAGTVWRVIAGNNQFRWPGIRQSVLERQEGDTVIARYKLSVPIYRDRRYRLRLVADNERMQLRFKMVPGYGNVREIRGSWEVQPLSSTLSQVSYNLEADPGVKWIPRTIVDWATKRQVPRLFAHLYDSGSRYIDDEAQVGQRIN